MFFVPAPIAEWRSAIDYRTKTIRFTVTLLKPVKVSKGAITRVPVELFSGLIYETSIRRYYFVARPTDRHVS